MSITFIEMNIPKSMHSRIQQRSNRAPYNDASKKESGLTKGRNETTYPSRMNPASCDTCGPTPSPSVSRQIVTLVINGKMKCLHGVWGVRMNPFHTPRF